MKKSWLLFLLATPVFCEEGLRIGEVVFGGTGCTALNTEIVVKPDGQTLGLRFQDYVAKAGGILGTEFDRKNCSIAISMQVPAHYQVAVGSIDVAGMNHLPSLATSSYNAEYFFAGSTGPIFQKKFDGPLDVPYELKNLIPEPALVWSGCGASTILRANTSVVINNNTDQQGSSSVEKMGGFGWLFNLKWKRC